MKINKFKAIKTAGGKFKKGKVFDCFGGMVIGVDGIPFTNKEYFKPFHTILDLEVGDKVRCTGESSFCTTYNAVVTKITTKYDENSGDSYPVIQIDGEQSFHGQTGAAKTPPYAYHIELI